MAQKSGTNEGLTRSGTHGTADPENYVAGAMRFAGSPDALYERHLKFDNVVEPESSDPRERYEAAARAVRDIVADRWLRTILAFVLPRPGLFRAAMLLARLGRLTDLKIENKLTAALFNLRTEFPQAVMEEMTEGGSQRRGRERRWKAQIGLAGGG